MSLEIIFGSMYTGKTTEIIRRIKGLNQLISVFW